ARQDLEPLQQRLRLGAAVQLDVGHDDVNAVGVLLARGLQHRVGLAHAGGGAEEHLELAAARPRFLLLDARQQHLGIGPLVGHAPQCSARYALISVPVDSRFMTASATACGWRPSMIFTRSTPPASARSAASVLGRRPPSMTPVSTSRSTPARSR